MCGIWWPDRWRRHANLVQGRTPNRNQCRLTSPGRRIRNPRYRRIAKVMACRQYPWTQNSRNSPASKQVRWQSGGSLDHNVYASFRSRMASYGSLSAAENIAMGTTTFGDTFAVWKSSSGHNANLLLHSATRIGIASASSHGTSYWALILAAPSEPNQPRVNVLSIFPFVMLMRISP